MLEFCLFGPGEISYQDRKITGLCHQLPGQLLCYLLLNQDRFHNRESLAAIFWGNYSSTDSRKALRNNLWRLRQALQSANIPVEEYIFLNEERVGFISSSPYTFDVENFETLIIPCRDMQGFDLSDLQVANLKTALSIYRGDLLESIYEDWCIYDRERLRMMFISTLHKLMVHSGFIHSYGSAIDYGKRLLALDNTLEKVHRQLMLLYWINGDRKTALTQYSVCRQILREELKCDPMEETKRIYKEMLHDQINPEDWDETLKSSVSTVNCNSNSDDRACKRIQSELHRLQEMIEDAQAASRTIEHLITEALNK